MKTTIKKSNLFLAVIFILPVLTVLLITAQITKNFIQNHEELAFHHLEQAVLLFDEKISSFSNGLYGLQGVYRAYKFQPSLNEIEEYARSRDYYKNFLGAYGFGFIRYVPNQTLENYLSRQRKINPALNFRQINKNKNDDYFIIESILPFEKNIKALGLDIHSEENRREAAINAINENKVMITNVIQLVQDNKKEPGFLIYLPIFKSLDLPKTKENLMGFAYTPIVTSEIIKFVQERTDRDFKYNVILNNDTFISQEFSNRSSIIKIEKRILGKLWHFEVDNSLKIKDKVTIFLMWFFSFILISIYVFILYWFEKLDKSKAEETNEKIRITNWLETILNSISFTIITTDTKGIIKSINQAGQNLLNQTEHELIDTKTILSLFTKEELLKKAKAYSMEFDLDLKDNFELFSFMAKNKSAENSDWIIESKDGVNIAIRLTMNSLLNAKNQIIGYIVIAEDIRIYKELENVIEEQRLSMIQSSKLSTLGEMAGGIAHEVNNPLAIISSKVSGIIRKIERNDIDVQKILEDLIKVDQTVHRISKIIISLRTISRDSGNSMSEIINLKDAIQDALDLCSERIKNHQIQLKVNNVVDLNVLANRVQLSQVLINLIHNSHDAVELLEEKWIEISVAKFGENAIVMVTDSGFGIDEENIDKIMQPFFTTKAVGKGTGLGLSISKSIIEKHGGKFWYNKSSLNTQFVIELPLASS